MCIIRQMGVTFMNISNQSFKVALSLSITMAISVSSLNAKELSPAMQAVTEVAQDEFRGYKPGNKEIRAKLRKLGKEATPQEIEDVMSGKVKDWIAVDIRNKTQRDGGHISVAGKRMTEIGRLKPTTMMQKSIMKIEKNKEIVQKAPKNIIILCRSGMKSSFDYASYAMAGFNDVKIGSVLKWVKSCRPLKSITTIEGAGVKKKGFPMSKREDGLYYWDECKK